MAVEEAEEEQEPQPKKAKSKLLLVAVIGVLLVALLGVGGFIVYTQVLGGGGGGEEAKKEAAKAAELKEAAKLGVVTALDPFIVNLVDDDGKRYLKVSMQLELDSEMLNEEVTNKMPQIKDTIITVLSEKNTDDLLTVNGKFKLKEQIQTRVNVLLKTGVVKNVYFVEFVIQ